MSLRLLIIGMAPAVRSLDHYFQVRWKRYLDAADHDWYDDKNVKEPCRKTLGGDELKNRVEKMRKERGLSQEDFAKAIRVSRQTVSSIETGKYNPSLELAFTIAFFFDRTIEEIFLYEGGTGDE